MRDLPRWALFYFTVSSVFMLLYQLTRMLAYSPLLPTSHNKTAFSDFSRLLFVAGLEGSGHHAVAQMMSVCEVQRFCEYEAELSSMMVCKNNTAGRVVGLFSALNFQQTATYLKKFSLRMTALARNSESHLHFVGLKDTVVEGDTFPGMMSYPNGPAVHKSLDRPDMHVLASLAEGAGLDLRVVVLLRDATAVLSSTVDRRHFGVLEAPALVANAESMYAQLSLLDAAFYRCVRYEQLTEKGLTGFGELPALSVAVLDQMLSAVRRAPPSTHMGTLSARNISQANGKASVETPSTVRGAARATRHYQEQQLQSRLDLISGLCTARGAWL